jgi:hypothetical protein
MMINPYLAPKSRVDNISPIDYLLPVVSNVVPINPPVKDVILPGTKYWILQGPGVTQSSIITSIESPFVLNGNIIIGTTLTILPNQSILLTTGSIEGLFANGYWIATIA